MPCCCHGCCLLQVSNCGAGAPRSARPSYVGEVGRSPLKACPMQSVPSQALAGGAGSEQQQQQQHALSHLSIANLDTAARSSTTSRSSGVRTGIRLGGCMWAGGRA